MTKHKLSLCYASGLYVNSLTIVVIGVKSWNSETKIEANGQQGSRIVRISLTSDAAQIIQHNFRLAIKHICIYFEAWLVISMRILLRSIS